MCQGLPLSCWPQAREASGNRASAVPDLLPVSSYPLLSASPGGMFDQQKCWGNRAQGLLSRVSFQEALRHPPPSQDPTVLGQDNSQREQGLSDQLAMVQLLGAY